MVFGFFKKLIKYYIDKLIDWMRMVKFDLELESQIKKYHDSFKKKEKPEIREVGKFGENGWSISIGDVNDKDTKN
tara:strand:- start:59 stop:283 length:225 start_codon:yes stop_codon:yes gene_type:complete